MCNIPCCNLSRMSKNWSTQSHRKHEVWACSAAPGSTCMYFSLPVCMCSTAAISSSCITNPLPAASCSILRSNSIARTYPQLRSCLTQDCSALTCLCPAQNGSVLCISCEGCRTFGALGSFLSIYFEVWVYKTQIYPMCTISWVLCEFWSSGLKRVCETEKSTTHTL